MCELQQYLKEIKVWSVVQGAEVRGLGAQRSGDDSKQVPWIVEVQKRVYEAEEGLRADNWDWGSVCVWRGTQSRGMVV